MGPTLCALAGLPAWAAPTQPLDTEELPTPVSAQIDWQGHPAMHLAWKFFRKGLTERTPSRSYRHRFHQVATAPYLEQSGVRIHLMAAMAAEKARNPTQARRLILKQIAYVDAFAAREPHWAVARSPAEARQLLADPQVQVIVHSIEGGHLLLEEPDDAAFWREQGVALVTLIHLRDDELGGSAILPMTMGPVINRSGARARRGGERRGLTERGRQAIVELDAAGMLVDLSHMTRTSIDDALEVTAAHDIAPVVTHGRLETIRDSELAFRPDQVVEVYRQGGIFSLGLSPQGLDPLEPTQVIPDDLCVGTVDVFRFHHEAVTRLVLDHSETILGVSPDLLGPIDLTRLAVGWSSDWNGWVHHAEPVYGRGRCRELSELDDDPLPVDTEGLAHPGLLPSYFERLERQGMDLEPMLRSAERFLQLWEAARAGPDDRGSTQETR